MSFREHLINVQNRFFQPLEILLRLSLKNKDVAPVWIIGAPRSGTTLAYQILCKSLNASYLSNRVAKRYRIALLVRILERKFKKRSIEPSSFNSDYGVTNSGSDPHEGGQFFYQFFSYDKPYTEKSGLSLSKKKSLKKLVNAIAYPNDIFISKNTVHSLRIKTLVEIFPNSTFVWVKRNKLDLVYSIVRSYKKNKVKEDEWWGVRVPGWEKFRLSSVEEKAVYQVNSVETIIEKDLKTTNAVFKEVYYKNLCEDPHSIISDVRNTLKVKASPKENEKELPEFFEYSTAPENELSIKIKDLLIRSQV